MPATLSIISIMKLIVGLGNPGDQYKDTRHNIGFMVIDKLARELGRDTLAWEQNKSLNASVAKVGEVLLVKPMTFMNNSGIAVKKVLEYFKIKPEDMWVIHDDIDLPIGKIRIRLGGASAGHNGMESVMKLVGTDKFVRFRLGIGRGKEGSVIHFVLSRFTQSEAGSLKHLVKHGVDAVRIALTDGIDKAMNRFN